MTLFQEQNTLTSILLLTYQAQPPLKFLLEYEIHDVIHSENLTLEKLTITCISARKNYRNHLSLNSAHLNSQKEINEL